MSCIVFFERLYWLLLARAVTCSPPIDDSRLRTSSVIAVGEEVFVIGAARVLERQHGDAAGCRPTLCYAARRAPRGESTSATTSAAALRPSQRRERTGADVTPESVIAGCNAAAKSLIVAKRSAADLAIARSIARGQLRAESSCESR